MAQHRTHSIAFKNRVVQEYLAGDTLHGLARRYDLSRNLIRLWVDKYEAGAYTRYSALGYMSPYRFEEKQSRKPVESAA